jgi:hypothetical protein
MDSFDMRLRRHHRTNCRECDNYRLCDEMKRLMSESLVHRRPPRGYATDKPSNADILKRLDEISEQLKELRKQLE